MLSRIEYVNLQRGGLLILAMMVGLSACSTNRGGYETMRTMQRFECQKLPRGLYETCMQDANKPYTIYEKELEELREN